MDLTATGRFSHIAEQLGALPDEPGIYIFRDAEGKALYVGKAKSLRKRVMSYFRKAGPGGDYLRIARMLKRVYDFEFVVTGSETEALLLESNFIKHYRPPYNIYLRDDKSYPYVAVTLGEEFPRVIITRKPHRPGVAYFGPFANAGKVRETIELLGKIFPYRKCRGVKPGRPSGSPCLNYHMGRCLAPCSGKVDQATYREIVHRVTKLLSGRSEGLVEEIKKEMDAASAEQNYERAAVMRNRLLALEHLLEKQRTSSLGVESMDVIGIYVDDDTANVQVLQVRDGSLSDRHSFFLTHTAAESETVILEQFMIQYYNEAIGYPSSIIVPASFSKSDVIGDFLTQKKGSRVDVRIPQRGRRRELAEMAERNAELALRQDRLRQEELKVRPARALSELKKELGLKMIPSRIECYDISNIGGEHAVGSMVVFEGGMPAPAQYRRFAIKETKGPDDYAMLAEVLRRRFSSRGKDARIYDVSFTARPDLVIVDGGAGQVSAATGVLAAVGEKGIPVIGIAKRQEEIYLSAVSQPLRLPGGSESLALVQRLRDEAHRFALDYHRKRRDRKVSASILDGIPGIGPARKKALLEYFGSPERFLSATRDELEAVPGLPSKVAREAYAYVHRFGRD